MYGKHFESMYEGSMRGMGSAFFAVWGFVISHMKPNRSVGFTVELNPDIVAFLIGEKVEIVQEKIDQMCQPDPKSRTKAKEGRKLERISEYMYLVVNGAMYNAIRNEVKRREYQRVMQAGYRAKKKAPRKSTATGPIQGERAFVRCDGDVAMEDRVVENSLPESAKVCGECGSNPCACEEVH